MGDPLPVSVILAPPLVINCQALPALTRYNPGQSFSWHHVKGFDLIHRYTVICITTATSKFSSILIFKEELIQCYTKGTTLA